MVNQPINKPQPDHQPVPAVAAPPAQAAAATSAQVPTVVQAQATAQTPAAAVAEGTNLETCLGVLAGVQDQVKFGDTKAAFVLAINTLMFGFVAGTVTTLKAALKVSPGPPSAWAWVLLVALIVFGLCAIFAVGNLIYAVMSRFGTLAPMTKVFFGHIATGYRKDYAKYVSEIRTMSPNDWLGEIGTQIVETSHIALNKHCAVRRGGIATIIGLVAWVVAVFSSALLP